MNRPGAAVRDERVIAQIARPFGGVKPDGIGHVFIDQSHHARGGILLR